MGRILATIHREWLQLLRDKVGLVVLFLMPVALVLVISLVQDNVMQATGTGEARITALFVDADDGDVGERITALLREADGFNLLTTENGSPLDGSRARQLVAAGTYQFAIVVEPGSTAALRRRARRAAETALGEADGIGGGAQGGGGSDPGVGPASTNNDATTGVLVWFDPLAQGAFRGAVTQALERVVLAVAMEEQAAVMGEVVPESIHRRMAAKLRAAGAPEEMIAALPRVDLDWHPVEGLAVRGEEAGASQMLPTASQQNVPAWTLFGMFFIVVPLAGSVIRERRQRTLQRLVAMSLPLESLLVSKILAYLAVCLLQCVLMFAVGVYLLPWLGCAALDLGDQIGALVLMATAAALAACAYGILVGAIFRHYEQASMFGAVSVVLTAAIGGIMLPTYVMPLAMRELSIVSPLGWGHRGFMQILVRHGDVAAILPWVGALLAFAGACLLIGRVALGRSVRG